MFERNVEEGYFCPSCGRFVKRYRRKLHAEMARFLIKLYRATIKHPKQQWFSTRKLYPESIKAATDGSYLVHWGLVEREAGRSGSYRITRRGKTFAAGDSTVRKKIVMLCGAFEEFDGPRIDIHQALGSKFDYYELMHGYAYSNSIYDMSAEELLNSYYEKELV